MGHSILITSPWSIFPWITLMIKKTYMEVVSFTFEFSWGVNFISHDFGDSFFNILHPLDHLGLAYKVNILDKRVRYLLGVMLSGLMLLDLLIKAVRQSSSTFSLTLFFHFNFFNFSSFTNHFGHIYYIGYHQEDCREETRRAY